MNVGEERELHPEVPTSILPPPGAVRRISAGVGPEEYPHGRKTPNVRSLRICCAQLFRAGISSTSRAQYRLMEVSKTRNFLHWATGQRANRSAIRFAPRPRSGGIPMSSVAPKAERIQKSAHEVIESKEFKRLVAKRWKVSMILLAALFVSYYGYIILVATAKDFVSAKVGEVTTLAIPLGLGTIVIAWVLTAFYVAWANRSYDPEVERLKSELKR